MWCPRKNKEFSAIFDLLSFSNYFDGDRREMPCFIRLPMEQRVYGNENTVAAQKSPLA